MRRLTLTGLIVASAGLMSCATCPPPTKSMVAPEQTTTRGLPNTGTWRVAILAGPGVSDVELYGLWYPLVAQGWRVILAAPKLGPLRAAAGLPVPANRTYTSLKPSEFDLIYVPGGAPKAAADVVRRFSSAGVTLATTTAGADALAAAGLAVAVASDEELVKVAPGVISAARPGDLPRLAHTLQAFAEDQLRVSHKATGGHPP